MIRIWFGAVMSGVLSLGAGCTAGNDAAGPGEAPASEGAARGYGYAFLLEPVTATPAAAKAPARVGRDRIAPETIQARVRTAIPAIRRCYDDARARAPELAGAVTLRFRILEPGTVAAMSAESSSLNDTGVRTCAEEAIAALTFPESAAGVVEVIYPLDFQP